MAPWKMHSLIGTKASALLESIPASCLSMITPQLCMLSTATLGAKYGSGHRGCQTATEQLLKLRQNDVVEDERNAAGVGLSQMT